MRLTGPESPTRRESRLRRRLTLRLSRIRRPRTAPPSHRALRWVRVLLATELVVALSVAAPPTALAETVGVLALVGSVDELLTNIRTWLVGILAGLATVFLTVAGARWVMGGGDVGEVEKAKQALRSAAVGYFLALLAPLLVEILKSLVGA